MGSEHLFEKFAFILVLGTFAQWFSWRLKFPALITLSILGLLIGPVFSWVDPSVDFGEITNVLVKLALAIILFEGGLNLKLHEFKKHPLTLKRLVSVGVVVAWALGTFAAVFVAGLSWPSALVIGAILVVTGPTVIMPLIRNNNLNSRASALIKWEGIVNDPIGALLAILVFEYFKYTGDVTSATLKVVWGLLSGFILGGGIGVSLAFFLGYLFRKGKVPESLKVVVVMSSVIFAFAVSNLIQHEAGLVAVTAMGLVLGNLKLKILHDLRHFKEHITIFLVSTVFILLTASLSREEIMGIDFRGFAFIAAILFVVRPLSIFISTIGTDSSWNERILLAWIAPRGVVAASMAGLVSYPMLNAGYSDADKIVPLVFGVVLSTVIAHSLSLGWVARKLGLAAKSSEGVVLVGASLWSTELAKKLVEMEVPVLLVDSDWNKLKEARLSGVPFYYGEILSENFEEHLDLSSMGYLLAATDNDAYNALICKSMAPDFGRDNVFQTAPHKFDTTEDAKLLKSNDRGRVALCQGLHYETLISRCYQGWYFRQTLFTENYTYQDYLDKYTKGLVEPVLVLKKSGKVQLDTRGRSVSPSVQDIVLSFMSPQSEVLSEEEKIDSKEPRASR